VTPQDIALVKATLDRPDMDALAADFYERLFAARPDLRELFPTQLDDQRRKFLDELRAIADAIGDLDRFVRKARELGERHVGYGVTTRDYRSVGVALLAAWTNLLPDQPETVAAWGAAYTMVAEAMMEGADANPFAAAPAGGP
jgi:hemoglobin-like flavoprotein